MSSLVVEARDLTKIYRLYTKPHYRFLDIFGLLRKKEGAYNEHPALAGVSLKIHRGEKVAVIGRNGAGKSTLLKLITGSIKQTSGSLWVHGETTALLQIGTGFHPDFTGTENVYAYLACLGISGRDAREKLEEIVAFAELEEYIDQPLRTYSTGMGARLMFATATVVSPEILILDEVLGVGDAYFARKSSERMRQLCDREGTTVLLVSHDVYTAGKICERMIWLDRGKVLMDGPAPEVVKAYEDSIREQEERRLRLAKQKKLAALTAIQQVQVDHVIVEIQSAKNQPLLGPVYFRSIRLVHGNTTVAELPLMEIDTVSETGSHLQLEASCWGKPTVKNGIPCRPMQHFGSPFHKVAGVFSFPTGATAQLLGNAAIELEYCSESPCQMQVKLYCKDEEWDLGLLPHTHGRWVSHRAERVRGRSSAVTEINTTGIHGTGRVRVGDIRVLDAANRETYHLTHGQPMTLEIDFDIQDRTMDEDAQVLVAFHRDGVLDVCRLIARDLHFDGRNMPNGQIRMHVPRFNLGLGQYAVTIMIVREGYFDNEQVVFYSINPDVYVSLSRVLEIEVRGGGVVAGGTGVVGEGQWSISPSTRNENPMSEVHAA